MVRMAVGAVMAFVVVLVLTLLFTDRDIKAILLAPVAAVPSVLTRCPATTEASCVGCTAADNATADEMEGAGASGEGAPRTPGAPASDAFVAADGAVAAAAAEVAAREERCRLLEERFGLSRREIEIMDLFAKAAPPTGLPMHSSSPEHGALASTSYLHEARCAHAPRTSRLP
ncbi:MAG: hypothetical protein ACLSGS_08635 [Adlercreutzia sp.]